MSFEKEITNEDIRKRLIQETECDLSGSPSEKYKPGTLVDSDELYTEVVAKIVEIKMRDEKKLAEIREKILQDRSLGKGAFKDIGQERYKPGTDKVYLEEHYKKIS